MSRVFKLAGICIGVVVAFIGVLLALLLWVIDPNDYKAEIAQVVRDKTDMTLALSERLEWTLWPSIGLKLGKTSLIDSAAKETLVAVDRAAVSVQLMPLLARHINIDAVSLEGAKVRFIQYADGTTSWDRLLNKLKSEPEKKSEKVAFNVKQLNVKNTALYLKDEKAGVERRVDNINLAASDINPEGSFPLKASFDFKQQDAAGKTLLAKNTIAAKITLDQTHQKYDLGGLEVTSNLSGTLLPAPADIRLKGDVTANMQAQQVNVANLDLALDYKDPALTAPATVHVKGQVAADLVVQIIKIDGLNTAASYPAKGLNVPATVNFTSNIVADIKQTQVSLSALQLKAVWPDSSRPQALQAALAATINANWGSGAVVASPLALNAVVPDKSFPKPLSVAFNGPLQANYKQGNAAIPAFVLDVAGVRTQGALEVLLPALRAQTPAGTALTKGMGVSGAITTATFNPRVMLAALGVAAPKTSDANTFKSASVNATIQGDDRKVLLTKMRVTLDESTLSGEAGINDLSSMRQYARLSLDKIDADRYLPPSDPAAKPSTGGLLPVEVLKKQNLDAAMSVGSLKIMSYPIAGFRVAATASNGVVNVSELKGGIYGGSFSVLVSINVQGTEPILNLHPVLDKVEIAPLAAKLLKKDLLAGKASYNGKLALRGNSIDAWMKSVSGDSNLKLDNGLLHGVNAMNELIGALGQYAALLPALTGKDTTTLANKQNDTEIASFSASNTLSNGVLNTKAMSTDLRKAKIAGSGNFNLLTQELDYKFNLNLDKSLAGEKYAAYALPVQCKGSLAGALAKLCKLDSRAVRDMLTKAVLTKELEKIGIKGGDINAAVDAKKQEVEAAAKLRIEEEKKKASEKLNQKLGEGLNKLFGR